jgi:DNA-binding TFAR19-related protein (PDSD5 family)
MAATQDDELTLLREQRRLELQKQLQQQATAQADAEIKAHHAQVEEQNINTVIKTILSPEARSRLATIAMATPQRAESIRVALIKMNDEGRIQGILNDEQFKQLLVSQSKSRHSASIRRI